MKTFPITLWTKPSRSSIKGSDEYYDALPFVDMEGEVGVEFLERGTIFGLMSRGLLSHMSYYADELVADIESGSFIERDLFYFDAGNTRSALCARSEDIVVAFKEFGLV